MPNKKSVKRKVFRPRSRRGGMHKSKRLPLLKDPISNDCDECTRKCVRVGSECDARWMVNGDQLYHPARIIDGKADGAHFVMVEFIRDRDRDRDPHEPIEDMFARLSLGNPVPVQQLTETRDLRCPSLEFPAIHANAIHANADQHQANELTRHIMRNPGKVVCLKHGDQNYAVITTKNSGWIKELNEFEKGRIAAVTAMRVRLSPAPAPSYALARALGRESKAGPLPPIPMLKSHGERLGALQGFSGNLAMQLTRISVPQPSRSAAQLPHVIMRRELSGQVHDPLVRHAEVIAKHPHRMERSRFMGIHSASHVPIHVPFIVPPHPTTSVDAEPISMSMLFRISECKACSTCILREVCATVTPASVVQAAAMYWENRYARVQTATDENTLLSSVGL